MLLTCICFYYVIYYMYLLRISYMVLQENDLVGRRPQLYCRWNLRSLYVVRQVHSTVSKLPKNTSKRDTSSILAKLM